MARSPRCQLADHQEADGHRPVQGRATRGPRGERPAAQVPAPGVPQPSQRELLARGHRRVRRRVLRPGGRLVILEPAPEQYFERPWSLLRFGWRGPYYWGLARFVHEPFAGLWHERDVPAWLERHGFELVEDRLVFPSRLLVAA